MTDKPRILVVDDNEDLLQSFDLVLRLSGYEVDMARDGLIALEKCRAGTYDAVLMDVMMPRMDGIQAFRRVRELQPELKVILMTAYTDEQEIGAALADGLYRAVGKPITVAALLKVLAAATEKPSVIIVDDDIAAAQALSRILELKGYKTRAVSSGEEAIRTVMKEDIRVALVDIKMPVMDGFETSERLKRLKPSIVSIIMTAYRNEALGNMTQKGTAEGYRFKPFAPDDAIGLVNKVASENRDRFREELNE